MKKLTLMTLAVLCLGISASAQDKSYFISPDGDDNASGLSAKEAWKSIDKVNSTVFQPGDKILFEGGKTFYGQLKLQGSGLPDKLITLTSYGLGGRPVIDFGEAEGAGILVENARGWAIIGMEVQSYAAPKLKTGRQGIVVRFTKGGEYGDYVIKDNYVHDIWGQMGHHGMYVGYNSSAILVKAYRTDRADKEPILANNLLVEGNRIERIDKCGIIVNNVKNNVVIRSNYIDNTGGDGIFMADAYRGLVEFNVIHRSCLRSGDVEIPDSKEWWPHTAACWIARTEETIMQFNEVYDTGRNAHNGDGFAYDFDFYCKRCIAQYNYSQNNFGLMLLMYNIFENVTRYNISENDHTHLVQMQGSLKEDKSLIHNNVFYIDHGMADLDVFLGDYNQKNPDELGARFVNNIFYATGQGRFRKVHSYGFVWDRTFQEDVKPNMPSGSMYYNNCYFGPWKNGIPDDPKALVADPKFVAPGTGGQGLCSLGGYKLKADSPCIDAGVYVENNGGKDFFGQVVNDGKPDIGAFEFLGSSACANPEELEKKDELSRKASSVAWAKWSFPRTLPAVDSEEVVISLREALTEDIDGTISWTDPTSAKKSTTIKISKAKDRKTFTIPVKTDGQSLKATTVKVSLGNGLFSEDFEIPFVEKGK